MPGIKTTQEKLGQKKPNGLELYDMTGNVYEWCSDWSSDVYYKLLKEGTQNPHGPKSGKYRVNRGGSLGNDADDARAAYRKFAGTVPELKAY